jgi:signal recognition particle subunit SEC65
MNETTIGQLVEHLRTLEYEIRKSITVREDQEENADPQHKLEAKHFGISVNDADTKGDLLNAVQTALRAAQANAMKK